MDYLTDLNDAQRQAVTHVEGPMLVLAGPGSGKTRVVTSRIAHLLAQDISPHNILALTFTNKAASEMQRRVERVSPGNPVWMSTFHRFCSRLLRSHCNLVGLSENFRIYDADDSRKALKSVIEDLGVKLHRVTPAQVGRAISNAKNELATPEQFAQIASSSSPKEVAAAEIYPEYQKRLIQSNAVDFDDLLMHIAVLLRENNEFRKELDDLYHFILVDEYQDTNLAQYTIVRALSIDHPNLAVTGDPDQSIYAWRGADIANILEFEKDYPNVHVVRLEQNYRSTGNILSVADQLISNNIYRKEKSLFTENPTGEAVRMVRYSSGHEEAEDIARQAGDMIRQGLREPRDFAVLYRTNALSRTLEHALHEHGVPYQIVNGVEFYQRKEIKDVMAYLHLLNNPRDDVAFARVINVPARGLGKKSLGLLRDHALRQAMPLMNACREIDNITGLSARARKSIQKFVEIIDGLTDVADKPVEAIVGRVLMDSGYRDTLTDSQTEEDMQRLANVEELVTAAKQYDDMHEDGGRLEGFLERTALVNETDAWDNESNKVTLMTLHAAKGLEFPVIYVIACEQGILPHERAREDIRQREEERRLLFVGITRAKDHLQLSLAKNRAYRGRHRRTVPSEFLVELPRVHMDCFGMDPLATYGGVRHADEMDGERPDGSSMDFEPQENALDEIAGEWAQAEYDQTQGDGEAVIDVGDDGQKSDAPSIAPVLTAAQMLRGDDAAGETAAAEGAETARPSPELFELGMLVSHPKYGPGRVIALSGRHDKRQATVQFLQSPEKHDFILRYSDLQPIGKKKK